MRDAATPKSNALRRSEADVVVSYLPVGSQAAIDISIVCGPNVERSPERPRQLETLRPPRLPGQA